MGPGEIKNLLHNKNKMVCKLKRPPTKWKNIFVSYISDKGLTTRIYWETQKLNSPKLFDLVKKWATELNRIFQRKKSKWLKNS
jgi:hypothetical protein